MRCPIWKVLASAELYNPATGKFTATGSMQVGREYFTATPLSDGRVLVAGGVCNGVSYPGYRTSSAELFNAATGTFTRIGSMSLARASHTATLLENGWVLIAGGTEGTTGNGVTATAELYDPLTRVFVPTGRMESPREFHTATRLIGGNVLVTGGDDGIVALSSAELFEPASGRFTLAGAMESPRNDHAAGLLTNGKVLITGGGNLSSAELYP